MGCPCISCAANRGWSDGFSLNPEFAKADIQSVLLSEVFKTPPPLEQDLVLDYGSVSAAHILVHCMPCNKFDKATWAGCSVWKVSDVSEIYCVRHRKRFKTL